MAGEPKVVVVADAAAVGRAAADVVAATVRRAPEAAIAVPTGSTPLPMFEELVGRVRRGELDLSRLQLFCLDEYVGVAPSDPNSLTGWLERVFLKPAGIAPAHVHTLPSTDPDLDEAPRRYERSLAAHGGLELAVLGLGGNGHIAYNEPGSPADSRTRVLTLAPESVDQAAGYFEGRAVPTRAMTVGVGTLLEARTIVLIVTGAAKADVLHRTLHEPMTAEVPASWLRMAGDRVTVIADEAAATG
ncbi:MAG TPA: glucosamine-6-phosphate deaminase [Thermomicrobiales bacterium]|jgi:glucosamine-6-phosphate deaminase